MSVSRKKTDKRQESSTKAARFWESRHGLYGICLALAAIAVAVFGNSLTHEFINYDDNVYVYDNPVVRQGLTLKGIAWAFTGAHSGNWHPLTWLSHMLDCQLYGLSPGGHHLTNLVLHTTTVILLFLVLHQMTGVLWRSAFVAAVFAIHPLRVESVAWVAERKDVLSGLFFVLAIGTYVHYVRHARKWQHYGLMSLLFALGLMCKPMLVTLPLLLLLLDYWPLQRTESTSRLALEKLPLLTLSAAACIETMSAQSEGIRAVAEISTPIRFANALVSCKTYLCQMIWPRGLAPFYPYPQGGLPLWELALAVTMLAAFSTLALWWRQKQPWILIGWLWYLLMLLPVLGIIQVGLQAHADRYTYLPQIGIYVALTWMVSEWMIKWRVNWRAIGIMMGALLAALMFCACNQSNYWKNNETLWTHTIACTTSNDVAHMNLGSAFFQKGRLGQAISEYNEVLKIRPNSAEAHANLGLALFKTGRTDEAMTHFLTALQIQPGYADAFLSLGNVFMKKGKVDEAISCFQKALSNRPDDADGHSDLGVAFIRVGRLDEAIAHFQKALELEPNCTNSVINLGTALLQKGRLDEATAHFRKALQLDPDSADARYGLGNVLSKEGRTVEAIAQYQQSLLINPVNPEVQNNLAWILATSSDSSLRDGNQALKLAQRANELTGESNPIVLHTLAAAFAEVGNYDAAVQLAQKSIGLAQSAGQSDLTVQLNEELKRYRAGLPCRQ